MTAADRLASALADRYRIERELGAGGMATVYLAHDVRHDRKVAIKVLKSELAAVLGAERFVQEIKTTAALSHPHILPLFDSGEAGGFLFYVMPYVEGETLRDRISREGELPVAFTLRVLREVTDALAAAHRRGTVHRDIKPDNVMLAEGHAMVADFGVAKAVSAAAETTQLTTAGMAVGTPRYMSPEQAAADPLIDHRSDIYAVGVLGYEMLTGRPPFTGTTPQAVLAALLTEQPDAVLTHRPSVPPVVNDIVMRCLERKPADRWQSADELLAQLERAGETSGAGTAAATLAGPSRASGRRRWVTVTVAVVGIAVVAAAGWSAMRDRAPVYEITNIRQLTRAPGVEFDPAISPDGREVVYSAQNDMGTHLYVVDVTGGRSIALTADLPGVQARANWLPDGRGITFVQDDSSEYLIPRFGGVASPTRRGSVFVDDRPMPASVNNSAGSLPRLAHSTTSSPDSTLIAYVTGNWYYVQSGNLGNIAPSTIWVAPARGGTSVEAAGGGTLNTVPEWLPDSRSLLFVSDRGGRRDLFVVRLDATGRPKSPPVRLTTGLNPHTVSVSADGSLVAYSQLINRTNIWAVDVPARGSTSLNQARPITTGNQINENFSISPDGRAIAYDTDLNGTQDIYIRRLDSREPTRLTTHPGYEFHPDLSPDGREVVFHSTRFGTRDLFLIGTDGRNEVRLTSDSTEEQNGRFSPDGLHISFRVIGVGIKVISRDSVGGAWSAPTTISPYSANSSWLPGSRHVALVAGDSVLVVDLGGRVTFALTAARTGLKGFERLVAAREERVLYVHANDDIGPAIYRIPLDGGAAAVVVRLDDPRRQVQFSMGMHGRTLYLSLAEHESDIFLADLVRK